MRRIFVVILTIAAFAGISVHRAHSQHGEQLIETPVKRALEAVELAAHSGDDAVIIKALDNDYPAVKSAALKVVAQKRVATAMPKLLEMYAWLNSPGSGPIFTGGGPFWDEERDPTAIELSTEIVAAIDALTGSAVARPRDQTQAERTRYLNDAKVWWQSAAKTGSVSAHSSVAVASQQNSFPPTSFPVATPAASRPLTTPIEQTSPKLEEQVAAWPWVTGTLAAIAIIAFVIKRLG